ncbi:MAG TPA: hypothetical protein VFJ97_12255 [Dermatophilaceae bacterium]|nr:hypothetical protein [Dermatophilaceae bacterium]
MSDDRGARGGLTPPGPPAVPPPPPGYAAAPPPPGYAAAPPPPGYATAPPPPGYAAGPPSGGYGPVPAAAGQTLFQAYKPGTIRLQALGLGDVLDGAITSIRFNPKTMIGMSVVVLALFLVPSAALSAGAIGVLRGQSMALEDLLVFASLAGAAGVAVFGQVATVMLTGLLIHVVGEGVLGRKPGLGDTWRATRGRLLPLIGLNLLLGLAFLLASVATLGPGLLLLARTDRTGAGVLLLLLGAAALLVLWLFVGVKTMLAGPALVLERIGVASALRRSWSLVRGAFWRLLGISVLSAVLVGVVSYILQLPFSLASSILLGITGTGNESGLFGAAFANHLSALLAGAVTTPFMAAVVGLLYIDRRIRLEALDLVLVRAAQGGPA